MDGGDLRLLRAQNGCCASCGGFLLHADHEPQTPREWEQWLTVTRKAMAKHAIVTHATPRAPDDVRLTHAHCRRRHLAESGASQPALPAREPSELA